MKLAAIIERIGRTLARAGLWCLFRAAKMKARRARKRPWAPPPNQHPNCRCYVVKVKTGLVMAEPIDELAVMRERKRLGSAPRN